MKRDLIITFATEFAVLACAIAVFRLASQWLGPEGFSVYALSRRLVSMIYPALMLGMGVGITRYIAFSESQGSVKRDSYFLSSLFIIIPALALSALFAVVFKEQVSALAFGSQGRVDMVMPLMLMASGLVLHGACYGYYRGRVMMVRANSMQAINLGLMPVAAFLMADSASEILFYTGLGWMLVSSIVVLFIVSRMSLKKAGLFESLKELFLYGIQRVPADFGLAALLTLPATVTAHMSGVMDAGLVAFGISIMNMSGAVMAPVGIIMLPKASAIVASGGRKELKYYVLRLVKAALIITVPAVVIFELFAGSIIRLYLGEGYEGAVSVSRLIMAFAPAYALYVSLRSIIDAGSVRAINTLNIGLALCLSAVLFMAAIYGRMGYMYIVSSFGISVMALGALSVSSAFRISGSKE